MNEPAIRVDIRQERLSIDEAIALVSHPGAGGIAIFLGTVRDANEGHRIEKLEYEAYPAMARAEMNRIRSEIEAEIPGVRVAALHRIGDLGIGDVAVVCAASSPHRGESFRACRMMIDRIKERVPIWKREHGPDGPYWIGWVDARTAPEPHEGHALEEPKP
ncbi:MAG TPA: molybdenum cofactor biosynthesis protein MoaE [Polyangiaceae bacterium]